MVKVKFDKKKKKYIELPLNSKDGFYLDGYLKSNLESLKKNLKQDYDAFIVIAGREGFGKSTLAMQIAMFIDPTFNLDRVCFTAEQFKEATRNAEKYQAIVFDETMGYLSSRQALSKFNRSIIKVMSEMRSKNLFVILNITNFFELDRYAGLHRTTGLILTYKRGFFGSYDYPTKKKLYLLGKRYYSYNVPPNFKGRFSKYFPIDKVTYEEKKQTAIAEWEKEKDSEKLVREQRDKLIEYIYTNKIAKMKEIGDLVGLHERTIGNILGS